MLSSHDLRDMASAQLEFTFTPHSSICCKFAFSTVLVFVFSLSLQIPAELCSFILICSQKESVPENTFVAFVVFFFLGDNIVYTKVYANLYK